MLFPAQATFGSRPSRCSDIKCRLEHKKKSRYVDRIVTRIEIKKVFVPQFLWILNLENIEYAAKCGIDRIELYTGPYANGFKINPEEAIEDYIDAAKLAVELGLGLNAGHDLDLNKPSFLQGKNNWFARSVYRTRINFGCFVSWFRKHHFRCTRSYLMNNNSSELVRNNNFDPAPKKLARIGGPSMLHSTLLLPFLLVLFESLLFFFQL